MSATVSIAVTPNTLSPVNKEIWFKFLSASYSTSDFKYIMKPEYMLEPFSTGTYSILPMYRIPPRPDGFGLYSPHRILKSYLVDTINPFQFEWNNGTGTSGTHDSLLKFRIKYGSEYNPGLTFSDTQNNGGYLQLDFGAPHGLYINDVIVIDKDNKIINQQFDGQCTITATPSSTSIVTDKTWSPEPYSILDSGNIISLLRYDGYSNEYQTWSGTRPYDKRTYDYGLQYILGTTKTSFLTNYPSTTSKKRIFTTNYETISMILPSDNLVDLRACIRTFNQTNQEINSYTYSLTTIDTNEYQRIDFGIGPMNLKSADDFGTYVTFSTCSFYRLLIRGTASAISPSIYYELDNRCSIYDNVRLCFLNRLGGWDYANFSRDSKKTTTINRTEYNKILDYNYTVGDRGKTVLSTTIEENWTATSDWLNEQEMDWMEELKTSLEVYLLDESNSLKYPIIITDTSYETKTIIRDRVVNMTINYKMAYPISIQNQ